MAKGRTRKDLSPEEKVLKALHALFILQAAQLGMNSHEMRKLLGVAMKDITSITKAVNKAIKKANARKEKEKSGSE